MSLTIGIKSSLGHDCDRGVVVSPWAASVLFFFLRSIQTKDWNHSNSVRTKTTSEKRRVEHTTSWLKVGFHVYVYLSPQLTLKQQRCVHERLGSHAGFSCRLNVLNGLLVTMKNRNQKVCFFFSPKLSYDLRCCAVHTIHCPIQLSKHKYSSLWFYTPP